MPDGGRQVDRDDDGWTLRLVRRIDAPLGQVYCAVSDPARVAMWMGPEGFEVAIDRFDFRVGGTYRLVMTGKSGVGLSVTGEFIEIEDGRCIAFTWRWEHDETPGAATTVRFGFAASGDGTEASLTHTGFPEEGNAVSHGDGWASTLKRLQTLLT